jgi:hypothetical protein
MSEEMIEFTVLGTTDDLPAIEAGLFLFLFARAYRGALDLDAVPDERLTFEEIFYDQDIRDRVARDANEFLSNADSRALLISRIDKHSPLTARMKGVPNALRVAVVLSGGKLDVAASRAELPPLETSISLLTMALERSETAISRRHIKNAPSQAKLDSIFEREHVRGTDNPDYRRP